MNISPFTDGHPSSGRRSSRRGRSIAEEFLRFISDSAFPCLAARGIGKREDFRLVDYGRMNGIDTPGRLADDLEAFTREWCDHTGGYRTFVATFSREPEMGETGFERELWSLLARLTALDTREWDRSVSANPESAEFSFSFAGEAYYIVGLHPKSGRPARRFHYPALVFNRHRFFEELRESGGYERMRELVRMRDAAEHGSINPMLADFGSISEARQYSGRHVEPGWRCPYAEAFGRRNGSEQNRNGENQ